ncbi:unnamed protein product, partial [Mycena citricolor]
MNVYCTETQWGQCICYGRIARHEYLAGAVLDSWCPTALQSPRSCWILGCMGLGRDANHRHSNCPAHGTLRLPARDCWTLNGRCTGHSRRRLASPALPGVADVGPNAHLLLRCPSCR